MLTTNKLAKLVSEIAYTESRSALSPSHKSIIPLLALCSYVYSLSIFVRRTLYCFGVFQKQRMSVPLISVGNLTWGGNGKTPMVEFIAQHLYNAGISPLILTRGYGGGDEVRMLQAHLAGTSARIGVGANRAAVAAAYLGKYACLEDQQSNLKNMEKIGAIILDDGMQHWRLSRDLDIVMVNGLAPWGNGHLIPHGPLREPLASLKRADLIVIHHADLITRKQLEDIELTVKEVKRDLPVFFSKFSPSCFLDVKNSLSMLPVCAVRDTVVLCVSAIGFSGAFRKTIEKIHPHYIDSLDFMDHHLIQPRDIVLIKDRLLKLAWQFEVEPVVVITEKVLAAL